jgi:release factor glutamine methyltransferase
MRLDNLTGLTLGETLKEVTSSLERSSETPGLDAQVLTASLMKKPRSWLLAHPDAHINANQYITLENSLARLQAGEPLPYILGQWEFFGMDFLLTPDVLIPRPETEMIVEHAIAWLDERTHGENEKRELRVIDVGTGSGCIAISLAVNRPSISITATDLSHAALEVARRNAAKHHVSDWIDFQEADLFPDRGSSRLYSLIISNPPYIPSSILKDNPSLSREPALALDGGPDGLVTSRRILNAGSSRLARGGALMIEIEASSGAAMLALAGETYPQARIRLHQDLAGRDRLLEILT